MSRHHPTTNDRAVATELTESERHILLASERRRRTLSVLVDRSGAVDLPDLAAAVARSERRAERVRGGAAPVSDDRVEQVAVALHHAHLPHMADLGVVSYDPESRRVETWRIPDGVVS